jgi:hypothetical protein
MVVLTDRWSAIHSKEGTVILYDTCIFVTETRGSDKDTNPLVLTLLYSFFFPVKELNWLKKEKLATWSCGPHTEPHCTGLPWSGHVCHAHSSPIFSIGFLVDRTTCCIHSMTSNLAAEFRNAVCGFRMQWSFVFLMCFYLKIYWSSIFYFFKLFLIYICQKI